MKLKNNRLGLVMGLLLAAPLATSHSYAQGDAAPPPPAPEAGMDAGTPPPPPKPEGERPRRQRPEGRGGEEGRAMRGLSPEEREKLQAAREKVMQDPEVVAKREAAESANKEFMELTHKKLLEADPSLKPILDKMEEARKNMVNRRPGPGGRPGPGAEGDGPPKAPKDPGARVDRPGKEGALSKLSKEEKEKLAAARQQTQDDPAVVAAREKVRDAATDEEKMEARKALQMALRDAMTKANPETAALLDKMAADSKKPDAVN